MDRMQWSARATLGAHMSLFSILQIMHHYLIIAGMLALVAAFLAGQKPVAQDAAQAGADGLLQSRPSASPHQSAQSPISLWKFVQNNCRSCHSTELPSGNVVFESSHFDAETANLELLQRMFEKVATGEMPPDDAPVQPSRVDLDRFIEELGQLSATLRESASASGMRSRLTNEEYATTVYDLLGVTFDPANPGGLVPDDRLQGFERVREAQAFSSAHAERYVAAAESIIEEAYPSASVVAWQWSADAVDLLAAESSASPDKMTEARAAGARIDLWPGQAIRTAELAIASPGDYQFRLQLSGFNSTDGRSPWLTVTAESLDRVLFAGNWEAAEESPRELRFTAHLPAGRHVLSIANQTYGPPILSALRKSLDRPFQSFADGYLPWQIVLLADDNSPLFPCLMLDIIQITGPHVTLEQQHRRDRFLKADVSAINEAKSGLRDFLEHAFRRTPTDAEQETFGRLLETRVAQGESLFAATKTAMMAVLSSPQFLYLEETPRELSTTSPQQWELASRLSYFLWNTMPDQELLTLARESRLANNDLLLRQFLRMVEDPCAERFVESFPRQWLQLDRVGMFPPDKSLYPNYDAHLEASCKREPVEYFRTMLTGNMPLREFLASDWAMLDARLAAHYGISNITSDEFVRVQLARSGQTTVRPDAEPNTTEVIAHQQRGGLLTQAGILALTSDGARQRPVHRGVWVWETILGKSIPAPPANVEPIATVNANQAKATIRDRLESHQKQPACASCHRKIDPLGFAFENYDALGRWRTVEKVRGGSGEDPPVDASGQLADGRTFADAEEFKQLLVEDIDQFAQAFVRKLAVYGLRRQLTPADEPEIERIVLAANNHGYRLRDVLEAFVMSDLFRNTAKHK